MKAEIISVQKEKKKVQKDLDDLKDSNHQIIRQINDLNKRSSNQLLKELHAHLLISVTEQIEQAFKKKNKENQIKSIPIRYDLQTNYDPKTLKAIKTNTFTDDEPIKLINDVINNFCIQSQVDKNNFIDQIINGEYTEDQFIEYLEVENDVTLMINSKEKDIIIKLLEVKVIERKNQLMKQSSPSAFRQDDLEDVNYHMNHPIRMVIFQEEKKIDTFILGEIESGCIHIGGEYLIMPNRIYIEVTNIYNEDCEISSCVCGDNVKLKLKNVEAKILSGFILCDTKQKPCEVGRIFDAQVEILQHKSTISSGYSANLHIHAAVAEIQLKDLIALIDRKTGATIEEHPRFIKQDQTAIARFELSTAGQSLCMKIFECYPQLGTFTLHDGERTVALGKVLKIIE